VENELIEAVETLLLDPLYQGFVATALAVSDEYDKGLIKNLDAFDMQCLETAFMIAGEPLKTWQSFVSDPDVPPVVAMALNALFNGAAGQRGGSL
jgi:hypothetical protein